MARPVSRSFTKGLGLVGLAISQMLVVVLVLLASSAPAEAGSTSANLTVQVTITAACTIGTATLDFSSIAGTSLLATPASSSTTVSTTCTNGSPYSIGMGNGLNVTGSQRRMISGGSNYINYNLYTDVGLTHAWTTAASSSTCTTANSCILGTGTGSAQSTTIYGQIPTVATAPATGSYSDTVSMTITY